MSNRLRWVAVYFILVLLIALAVLLIVWTAPPEGAYHGMNWKWPIA